MEIKYFTPRWGYEHEAFAPFCERVAAAGFDGIELNLAEAPAEAKREIECMAANGLTYIAQHSGTRTADFEMHKAHYRSSLERIASLTPPLINAHTGHDLFTFGQNLQLVRIAAEISNAHHVPIIHETHRGRFTNLPGETLRFIETDPSLRLVADFSHWCCATESFLEDHGQIVEEAIGRTDLIHARIGFDQGPQVYDPQAPEWQEAVEIHLAWWRRIVARHAEKGTAEFPVTTEFGPPPYSPVLPRPQQPRSNQWELNLHMMALLRNRL